MSDREQEIIEGLLKWWNHRHGMVVGSRNANLYKLAAAFNEYGISQASALSVCLRYVDLCGPDPFTEGEITSALRSAYRRTKHAIKQWAPAGRSQKVVPRSPRVLTHAQAQAVEDKLVEMLQRKTKVVRRSAPVPHPPAPRSVQQTHSEEAVKFIAKFNLEKLVQALELDVSKARVIRK